MPIVTVLDDYQQVALHSADWSPVQSRFAVDVVTEHINDAGSLATRLAGSQVVMAMRERTPLTGSLLHSLPDLRLIVTTGMRNAAIDLDAAADCGITVCGTESSGNAVPEITMGMIIALMRNFVTEDAAVRAGGWQHTVGRDLGGSALGVVGLGRLGIPVARLAQAFGMRVIAWSPNLTSERAVEHGVEAVEKLALFEGADVVTVHMPLSARSRGLIGVEELAALGPRSYLVNTSRGPIVDEDALVNALNTGVIAGAALDVYGIEPLPVDHPLRSAPRTLLLPHLGYVTEATYQLWFRQVVEDIVAWFDGRPVRVLE